jgi:hypothetical protein
LYSRPPTDREAELGMQFVSTTSDSDKLTPWERYAQALLSTNEFMHVD